jgi:hypothetical protein
VACSNSAHRYERVWNEDYHFVKRDESWTSCIRQPCPHRLNGRFEDTSDESLIPIEPGQASLIIAVGQLLPSSAMSTHPNSPAPGIAAPQPHAVPDLPRFDTPAMDHAATPTQNSGPPSLADLTQMMQTLITTTQTLAISMQGLVHRSNGGNPRSVVEKPQLFKGNGSENARIFWSAFLVFAHD